MSLLEIIKNSDNSKLLDLSCDQDEITLTIARDYLDKIIRITFPFQNFFSSFSSKSDGICFLSIENIKDSLNVENGVYIPSTDFGDFMYDVREGNSSGYGLRESKFKIFFKVIGSFKVVIPVENFEKIKIEFLSN
ncbi:hypothetical protein EA756_11195 [Acinetobacter lactucae]|uniref:Uncharacterized protein n=1 Tax=Acinetobacter lactucae TaxID=1785128 RepID=A0A429JYV8_9GAMM|nr:hypothetical protein EA756_11195 [Acinetobacter lactucae]